LRWANRVTLLVSITVVALAFLARLVLGHEGQALLPPIWLLAGILVPLVALLRIQQAALRSMHRAAIGLLPDSLLVPILMLGFIVIAAETGWLAPTAEHALLAQVVAASAALVVAVWLVVRTTPEAARKVAPRYLRRAWLTTSGRMFMLGSLAALNGRIGILMVGIIAAPELVGPYAVALRGASFVSLAMNVTVLAAAPAIATIYSAGQLERLGRLARQMSLVALIGGAPVAVALVLWGRSLLAVFGADFEGATTALAILVVGEIVNVGAGPVATLLLMTGNEGDAVLGLALASALNAGLCLILIPQWGINGAAVAAAASLTAWNLFLARLVRTRLAIAPSFLASLLTLARSSD
jgi:O-antigen/teichoic acid export membrane protein